EAILIQMPAAVKRSLSQSNSVLLGAREIEQGGTETTLLYQAEVDLKTIEEFDTGLGGSAAEDVGYFLVTGKSPCQPVWKGRRCHDVDVPNGFAPSAVRTSHLESFKSFDRFQVLQEWSKHGIDSSQWRAAQVAPVRLDPTKEILAGLPTEALQDC